MISPERVRAVCTLFFRTKALMLKAEELDNNNGAFLQPTLELKAAFDHVVRALAREYGVTQNGTGSNDQYVDHQLDKSIGHIYRAYFDTADWISINFRETVKAHLNSYDNADISTVIPEYFKEISPRFSDYETEIARLRAEKDISTEGDDLFNRYESLLERLGEDVRTVVRMIPALDEHASKRKRTERRTFWRGIADHALKYIVGAGIGAALAWLAFTLKS